MINATSETMETMINAPVRHIGARVELYEGSALADVYNQYYALKSLTIDRVGENDKFMGFGICQRINLKLIDKERYIYITTADSFKVYMSVWEEYTSTFPPFYVSEVHRDENTNELSITAYDALYKAAQHTAAELTITTYTIRELAAACAALIGVETAENTLDVFDTEYPQGANLDGTETIREVLDAIAEATQTIYYIDANNKLVFKRLDRDGAAVYTISKDRYITLDSKTNRRLATVCHTTELGDNVAASTTESGSTQYIRDNPLWEMREDIGALVDAALAAAGGLTINQFNCSWRGNFLLEIGDKIALETKDGETVFSYLLDDVITYDGTYSHKTKWEYADNDTETASNPTTLGDALKQTFARVDKANKEIELVASIANANSDSISSLTLNTDSIAATVQAMETTTNVAIDGVKGDITELNNKVSATMTAEQVLIEIETGLANGAGKVITNTGFTFDDEGLTVSKSDSEMETQITEDGMTVYKNGDAVLTANNIGVDAVNLHATTYLIIGNNSRFEDYGSDRTGCFWIGEV